MAKMMKTIRERFTPPVVQDIHRISTLMTIMWVSTTLLAIGFGLALVGMYNHQLMLEQALGILASR